MNRSDLFRIVGLAVLGSLLLLAVTLPSLGVATNSPVMQIWPTGANNRAISAAELVTPGVNPAVLAAVAATSRGVLAQEPTNVAAARTLGLVASLRGDATGATRLLNYAEKLSRRDKLTQLALIEDNVNHASVGGALLHYDRLLRTSPDLRGTLLPILRGASSDPNVAPQLADLVARRPLWWGWFINSLVNDPADSSRFLDMTARRMRPSLAIPLERELLTSTIGRLIAAGQPAQALALYMSATGTKVMATIRDGGFERDAMLPPLDWQLTDADGFGATREPGDDGSNVLKLNASLSQSGVVARQFLLLAPRSYRLTLRVGGIDRTPGADPVVRLSCADGRELVSFALPEAGGRSTTPEFSVPAGCGGQWLKVTLKAPEIITGSDDAPWIDDISVVPAGNRP